MGSRPPMHLPLALNCSCIFLALALALALTFDSRKHECLDPSRILRIFEIYELIIIFMKRNILLKSL